jgi:hypothetical protein
MHCIWPFYLTIQYPTCYEEPERLNILLYNPVDHCCDMPEMFLNYSVLCRGQLDTNQRTRFIWTETA